MKKTDWSTWRGSRKDVKFLEMLKPWAGGRLFFIFNGNFWGNWSALISGSHPKLAQSCLKLAPMVAVLLLHQSMWQGAWQWHSRGWQEQVSGSSSGTPCSASSSGERSGPERLRNKDKKSFQEDWELLCPTLLKNIIYLASVQIWKFKSLEQLSLGTRKKYQCECIGPCLQFPNKYINQNTPLKSTNLWILQFSSATINVYIEQRYTQKYIILRKAVCKNAYIGQSYI